MANSTGRRKAKRQSEKLHRELSRTVSTAIETHTDAVLARVKPPEAYDDGEIPERIAAAVARELDRLRQLSPIRKFVTLGSLLFSIGVGILFQDLDKSWSLAVGSAMATTGVAVSVFAGFWERIKRRGLYLTLTPILILMLSGYLFFINMGAGSVPERIEATEEKNSDQDERIDRLERQMANNVSSNQAEWDRDFPYGWGVIYVDGHRTIFQAESSFHGLFIDWRTFKLRKIERDFIMIDPPQIGLVGGGRAVVAYNYGIPNYVGVDEKFADINGRKFFTRVVLSESGVVGILFGAS